jgi:transcriptional regulator with XRE-family HTH domain
VDIHQRLAINVRRLREEKGWSQEKFAFESNIHRTYISDIERAGRNPTIEIVERIAISFGTTASALLEEPSQEGLSSTARR